MRLGRYSVRDYLSLEYASANLTGFGRIQR